MKNIREQPTDRETNEIGVKQGVREGGRGERKGRERRGEGQAKDASRKERS